MNMKIQVGGHRPHPQNGVLKHKGPQPRIYGSHGGTNLPMGKVHEAPTRPQVNAANYAGHKIGRKK
jgi:hypothetical protein